MDKTITDPQACLIVEYEGGKCEKYITPNATSVPCVMDSCSGSYSYITFYDQDGINYVLNLKTVSRMRLVFPIHKDHPDYPQQTLPGIKIGD